jgi:hypothetical protein
VPEMFGPTPAYNPKQKKSAGFKRRR